MPDDADRSAWPYIGVGCVTTVAGFFGGGMIGVFVGWIVGHLRRCTPLPDTFPICDFFPYWIAGMMLGAVLVPTVALTRLRQSHRRRDAGDKGRGRDIGGTR
jgi:CDP-diglyceride synthetase